MAILIIEDEFLVAVDIRFHLQRAGFGEVEHAATEAAALAAIALRDWTAAVVDANLNGKGIDAIAVALKDKDVPFVIVTGYGRNGLPGIIADVPVIEKPFKPETLLQAVTRLCEDRGR
jgi:DNA-binding response OmpR family regulator